MSGTTHSDSTPPSHRGDRQPQREGVDMVAAYRSMLNIVTHLDKTQYTEDNSSVDERQTEVVAHSDLADLASDSGTSQG